jgi:hypothetical protein
MIAITSAMEFAVTAHRADDSYGCNKAEESFYADTVQ